MHVLITRPQSDAADLKSRIEALGCRVTLAPLLDIALNEIPDNAFEDAGGIVATSRNGLRALAVSSLTSGALEKAKSLPVFVVGPATAALARDLGFKSIVAGAGTATDLVPVITQHPHPPSKRLVHLAGDHLAFDLAAALKPHGFAITSVEAYRSVAAKVLPQPVPDLLAVGALDAVILMSPRSASVWSDLVNALPTPPNLAQLTHVCLSKAVAQELRPLQADRIEVAGRPVLDEIVALVYRLAGAAKTG